MEQVRTQTLNTRVKAAKHRMCRVWCWSTEYIKLSGYTFQRGLRAIYSVMIFTFTLHVAERRWIDVIKTSNALRIEGANKYPKRGRKGVSYRLYCGCCRTITSSRKETSYFATCAAMEMNQAGKILYLLLETAWNYGS